MITVICDKTPGSDVRILKYTNAPGMFNYQCEDCVRNSGVTIACASAITMLLHLRGHKREKHRVPGYAKVALWKGLSEKEKAEWKMLKPANII